MVPVLSAYPLAGEHTMQQRRCTVHSCPHAVPSRTVIQEPIAQQVKTGPPVTLALEQLEPVHGAFDLSLTVVILERPAAINMLELINNPAGDRRIVGS